MASATEQEEVVMRRPRNVFAPSERQKEIDRNAPAEDGKKRVNWSESTELREKLKVYRRSQLDIPLNYHHIASEEAREKEGVKKWRDSLQNGIDLAEVDDRRPSINQLSLAALRLNDDNNSVSDESEEGGEDSDSCDEDLEKNLLIIKGKSTKYTIQPAYTAAIKVYKDWLSHSSNTKGLSEEKVSSMKSQRKLYKKVVKIYQDWGDQADDNSGHFDQISCLLQEAADLGTPPQPVSKTISEQLADPDNVKKQVDSYNNMVQDMLNAREEALKT